MAYRATEDAPVLTEREFAALPDDDLYTHELVAGRLVREPRPGFRHGRLSSKLTRILEEFVEAHGLGAIVVEAGFRLADDPLTELDIEVARLFG